MEEKTYIIQQEVFTKIKKFLKLKNFLYDEQISLEDNIKKLCVKKLCEVVGIKCDCNYKNKFFNYFAKEHQVILFTCHGFIANDCDESCNNLIKL